MSSTTVELPPELVRALDEIATRSGRSRDDVVLSAVRDFVEANAVAGDDPGFPRSIGMFSDDEVTGENYEEWLLANWRPEADWERS